MKELRIELKNKEIVHSEYIYQYDKEEDKKEYLEKINEYAKKIEHEANIISDEEVLEIEKVNFEELQKLKQEKIAEIKNRDFSEISTVTKLKDLVKELIELL